MNVVQVNFHFDRCRRDPEAVLDAMPTLTGVAEATVRAGCQVTVIQASHETKALDRNGVRYRFVAIPAGTRPDASRGARWFRGWNRLCSTIMNAEPDLVHIHGIGAPLHTRNLIRSTRVPVIAQDHATRPAGGFRRTVQRWAFRDLAGVTFTSREQAQPFIDARILSTTIPVFEVLEGSSTFTPENREEARARSGLSGEPSVLWVGRLNQNKDPLTVLDGVEGAIPDLPRIQLWCLYTDAPLLDRVQARLDSSPALKEHVHLIGAVSHPEIEDFYRSADLFVLGSHVEGSGYALLEAMACGTPPLVTDIPSFRKITGNGAVGSLFRVGDAHSLTQRLVEWSRTGDDPRRKVRRHFDRFLSFDAIGRQLTEAYDDVLRNA